jgi:WD40 repeat protein
MLNEGIVKKFCFLKGHNRKVVACRFNPVASSVIASGCYDQTIKIWYKPYNVFICFQKKKHCEN